MVAPSVIVLFIWMIVPLALTLWFSFQASTGCPVARPERLGRVRQLFIWFLNSPDFWLAIVNTLTARGRRPGHHRHLRHPDRAADRPADLGPGPAAHPGDLALLRHAAGGRGRFGKTCSCTRRTACWPPRSPIGLGHTSRSWFSNQYPMASIIFIVSWEWLPFATLILLTALQSLSSNSSRQPKWTAPPPFNRFRYHRAAAHVPGDHRGDPDPDHLPSGHLRRDLHHHRQGGPGYASTTCPS